MFLKEHNISVRLPQEKTIDTGIVFVQNDKGVYKLNVRVFDGDTEINYSQVSSATITFSKADGTVVQGDMQKATNMLAYVLGTNEIAAPGKLLASIQLLGANERLTTARFVFNVEKDLITEDAVKSTSEFPILQQLKQELEDIDVVELTNQFNAHKADLVTDSDGVHGFKIEQGTWTPYFFGNTTPGTPTYIVQSGYYYKINRLVFISCNISISAIGGMEGTLLLGGLPFPVSGNQTIGGISIGYKNTVNNYHFGFIPNTSRLQGYNGVNVVDSSGIPSNLSIQFTGVYLTN